MKTSLTNWKIEKVSDLDVDLFVSKYGAQIGEVTQKAFMNEVNLEPTVLAANLRSASHVGTIIDHAGKLRAFCILNVYDQMLLQGKALAWVNKIAISPEAQGFGFGSKLLLDKITSLTSKQLGWIGCCTQSNSLIYGFSKIAHNYFPFEKTYGSAHGIGPWTYLTLHVKQVQERLLEKRSQLDVALISNYGIIKHGFPKKINVSERVLPERIRQNLNLWGFDQAGGDMLILLAEV